jgi:DNA repair exonuclease SbcCD ATPase subunit/DNA repair exonuclease SbcCD nuclease subunit
MKIAHLADIHIRGTERIPEYRTVFSSLYKSLNRSNIDLIIIAGDIFHTKTQNITPEGIELIAEFFINLANIAETHILLGNHDGNLKNEQSQDVISPIVQLINNKNLVLHKQTESVAIGDMEFYFYSLFDKKGWETLQVQQTRKPNVCVFHGSVLGCIADNGFALTEHAEVEPWFFSKFDFSLLGDIHKRQSIGKNNRVHYAGSLIQQNFGEELEKGYLVWDIKSRDDFAVNFVKLPNPNPFITIDWETDLQTTKNKIFEAFKTNQCQAGWKLKIKSQVQLTENDKQSLLLYANTKLDAKKVEFDEKVLFSVGDVEIDGETLSKEELKTNKEKIKDLYESFVKQNKTSQKTIDLEKAKLKVDEYVGKLDIDTTSQVRDAIIRIENFEFDNVFAYGPSNKVNFNKLDGLVGILGKNRIGKSSLIGSVALTLYNITDRAPVKSAFVVNNKEKEACMRMQINLSGQRYLIERRIEKQIPKKQKKALEDEDKALTSLKLFKLDKQGTQYELNNQNSVTRTDTEKVLRNIIGTPEDFLFTSLSSQGQMNAFINSGATYRKELLNRFLDLDIFKSLYTLVNEDYNLLKKGSLKDYNPISLEERVKELEAELEIKRVFLQDKEQELSSIEEEISSLPDSKEYDQLHSNLFSLKTAVEKKNQELSSKKQELDSIRVVLEQTKLKKESLLKTLKESTESLNEIQSEVKALESELSELQKFKEKYLLLQKDIESSKKLVKKLDIVPCGDMFPTCVYIKDAHDSKKNLELLQKELLALAFDDENFMAKKSILRELKDLLEKENMAQVTLKNQYDTCERKEYDYKIQIGIKETQIQSIENDCVLLNERLKECADKCASMHSLLGIHEMREEKIKFRKEKQREINTISIDIGRLLSEKEMAEHDLVSKKQDHDQLEILETILAAFSKNGIPAMLLNTQLPSINKIVNDYLSGIVDFKLKFVTEVGVNTLDIYIEDTKPRRVIELASGMEKMISSLAVRAALMQLTPLPKLDSLIIDEGFEALDEANLQNVIKMLNKLKQNFRSIIVITHIPLLKEYMDKIIEIQVDNETHQSKILYT